MTALTSLHWLLAYSGALIYVLLKIQELNRIKGYKFGNYLKENWPSTIATVLMIPVCMFILKDNFEDVLPINNLTAVLVGYQTNQVFRSMMSLGKKKYNIEDENI